MQNFFQYLRNAWAELSRVTWPTRNEVIQATEATLLFVIFTIFFLMITDATVGKLVDLII